MATPFAAVCDVSISSNYDTVGTLTRSSLKPLTPTEWKALFTDGTQWHEMTAYLKTQFEMRACGIQRNGMYDWIMSSTRPGMGKLIDIRRMDRGPSLIQPFIMGRQNSIVSADYWQITTGYATGNYTPGTTGPLSTVAGGTRVIRVTAGYGMSLDAKFFNPKHSIYILNRAAGVAQHGEWRVIESALANDGTYIDVLLASQNTFDTTTVDTAPTTGVVLVGMNNVMDVEKYCHNGANWNPLKHVPFWYQFRRRTRRVDSHYREIFKKLQSDNQYFEAFADLTLAERNRQDEMIAQRQFVHSFFFGRPISNAQRLEGSPNWTSLEEVLSLSGETIDPGTGGRLSARRANMIGVYEILKACSRVRDNQNGKLNIATFLEEKIFDIVRAREAAGRPSDSVDIYTDSGSADQFMIKFFAYMNNKFGNSVSLNVSEGSNKALGFAWHSFKLSKPMGVTVNIITHRFFDDIVNAFESTTGGSQASRGRFLAVLDLGKGGTIFPAILASNRKQFTTGQLEELAKVDASFACVMENPTIETTMTSEAVTAIVESPKCSWWDENFASICSGVGDDCD